MKKFPLACKICFFGFILVIIVSIALLCGSLYGVPEIVIWGAALIPVWALLLVLAVVYAVRWHDHGAVDPGPHNTYH